MGDASSRAFGGLAAQTVIRDDIMKLYACAGQGMDEEWRDKRHA